MEAIHGTARRRARMIRHRDLRRRAPVNYKLTDPTKPGWRV